MKHKCFQTNLRTVYYCYTYFTVLDEYKCVIKDNAIKFIIVNVCCGVCRLVVWLHVIVSDVYISSTVGLEKKSC